MSRNRRLCLGLSLVECSIVLATISIGLGVALPGLDELRVRQQVDGAAAQLETDLMLARASAVALDANVRASFATDASGSCYVVHAGAAGDCHCSGAGEAVCRTGAQVLRSAAFPLSGPIQVASRSSSIVFDPTLGTVTPTATIRVESRIGSVHQIINIMGRVRSCVPAPGRSGYRTC